MLLTARGLVVCLSAFWLAGAIPACTNAPTTRPVPATQQASAESNDEFAQMIKLNNLTGEQLARFETKRKQFYSSRDTLDAGSEARRARQAETALDAAKASKDEARITAAQAQAKEAHAEYMKKRSALRAAVMIELTLPQQQKWAGVVLAGRVYKTYGKALKHAGVDDAQTTKIHDLCDRLAADFVKADTIADDPYLFGLEALRSVAWEQIKKTVLTPEQTAKVEPTTKPATAPTTNRNPA